MHIIIDGYNLIGTERGLTGALEHRRNRLVHQLSLYRKLKDFELTVVFDGWRSGHGAETIQKSGDVRIVYSRQGEKADGVVVRLARAQGSGCVVVSSDREVANAVEKFGAVAIPAGMFGQILRSAETYGAWPENEDEEEDRHGKKGAERRMGKQQKRRLEILRKLRP